MMKATCLLCRVQLFGLKNNRMNEIIKKSRVNVNHAGINLVQQNKGKRVLIPSRKPWCRLHLRQSLSERKHF